jgi:hypothetical protein
MDTVIRWQFHVISLEEASSAESIFEEEPEESLVFVFTLSLP